jgi:hypothetical protein
MSFFDKVKQGASDAAKKAQQTVEITKLRGQISSKEKEFEKTCLHIGDVVFQAYSGGNWKQGEQSVIAYCEHMKGLRQDIQTLELKIKLTKNEKECRCGKIVAIDVKFCPGCGFAFPIPQAAEEIAASEIHRICHVCRTKNETDAQYCAHCGIAM